MVGGAQADVVLVGDDGPGAVDGGGLSHRPPCAVPSRKFDGLDAGARRPGERGVHRVLHATLEPIEHTHVGIVSARPPVLESCGAREWWERETRMVQAGARKGVGVEIPPRALIISLEGFLIRPGRRATGSYHGEAACLTNSSMVDVVVVTDNPGEILEDLSASFLEEAV